MSVASFWPDNLSGEALDSEKLNFEKTLGTIFGNSTSSQKVVPGVCEAGGKPSTWFPPGRLVEQESNTRNKTFPGC